MNLLAIIIYLSYWFSLCYCKFLLLLFIFISLKDLTRSKFQFEELFACKFIPLSISFVLTFMQHFLELKAQLKNEPKTELKNHLEDGRISHDLSSFPSYMKFT